MTEVTVPDGGPNGGRVTDHLHPEWANLRVFSGDFPDSQLPGQPVLPGSLANFTGPTSLALKFMVGTSRIWGIGILPLGWARFIGQPAKDHADAIYPAADQGFLTHLQPLITSLFGPAPDEDAELARINSFFLSALAAGPNEDDQRIIACHTALLDPEIATVADMAEAARLPAHTLERVCRRHFGFTPRLLLRRQRFMRSLVQYLLDPSLHWIGAIDSHYHDQAQFVRDFHRFMGMSPSEYAATPKPILTEVMRARHEFMGSAVQALHSPVPQG